MFSRVVSYICVAIFSFASLTKSLFKNHIIVQGKCPHECVSLFRQSTDYTSVNIICYYLPAHIFALSFHDENPSLLLYSKVISHYHKRGYSIGNRNASIDISETLEKRSEFLGIMRHLFRTYLLLSG